ncbi:hypothetical protein Trydic_g21123 [Trypoxylus dichotomus]
MQTNEKRVRTNKERRRRKTAKKVKILAAEDVQIRSESVNLAVNGSVTCEIMKENARHAAHVNHPDGPGRHTFATRKRINRRCPGRGAEC